MTTSTLLLVTLFIILLTIWIFRRRQRHRYLRSRGFPGPEAHFVFGNVLELLDGNVKWANKWLKEYGKFFTVVETAPALYTSDPEFVRQIQLKDFSLFSQRRTFFAEGGFDADPEHEVSIVSTDISPKRWKEQRALITSAFTSSKIRASVPLVSEAIDVLMENIEKNVGKEDFDIYDLFQRLTMDTIGRSAFGTNLNVQRNPDNEFYVATKRVFDNLTKSWTMQLSYASLLFPEFFNFFYPLRKLQRVILKWMGMPTHFTYQMDMCAKIMEQRKEKKMKGEETPDDFLQRLIDASLTNEQMKEIMETGLEATAAAEVDQKETEVHADVPHKRRIKSHRMSDEEVVSNACIMFDAGFETTSTFLGFLFHVLVNRQDIQEEVRREVIQLKEQDGRLDENTIHALPYLTSLMYETLRYFPPVTFFVSRQSTVEYKYKDMTIPPDTGIEIIVPAMHRDPEYWDQPETFDPLRFYGENKVRAQSPAFQAFGAGPRNCLGMRFALMEAKLVVARILSEYRMSPGPRTEAFDEIELDYKPITQNPKNGVFVRVSKVQ